MVLTGGYHSQSHVIDLQRRINTTINVQFQDKRGKQCGIPRFYKNKRLLGSVPIPPQPKDGDQAQSQQSSSRKRGQTDVPMTDSNSN